MIVNVLGDKKNLGTLTLARNSHGLSFFAVRNESSNRLFRLVFVSDRLAAAVYSAFDKFRARTVIIDRRVPAPKTIQETRRETFNGFKVVSTTGIKYK